MKHFKTLSRKPYGAYGVGIGQYLLIAGQILGILALMFVDKPEPEDTAESR